MTTEKGQTVSVGSGPLLGDLTRAINQLLLIRNASGISAAEIAALVHSRLADAIEASVRRGDAVERGAGDPPAGYEELEPGSDALRIADECWHNGMDVMKTTILDVLFDELRCDSPNTKFRDGEDGAPHSP